MVTPGLRCVAVGAAMAMAMTALGSVRAYS